jgi:hypothetical protein
VRPLCALLFLLAASFDANPATSAPPLLTLSPRVCTLTQFDADCETTVRARWQSRDKLSLCLVIVDQPHVKRCWENHEAGEHTVELVFAKDLIVELRDPELTQVLTSQTIAVIREAIRLRHKRRQPWNIFY